MEAQLVEAFAAAVAAAEFAFQAMHVKPWEVELPSGAIEEVAGLERAAALVG